MITFISCLAILIIGYFVYGTYVDKNAKLSDDNQTPAVRLEDGVDYMPMPWYKVIFNTILKYSRYRTYIRCYNGSIIWTSSIFMDNIWYYICRWSTWLLIRCYIYETWWYFCFWNSWYILRRWNEKGNESILCYTY